MFFFHSVLTSFVRAILDVLLDVSLHESLDDLLDDLLVEFLELSTRCTKCTSFNMIIDLFQFERCSWIVSK